ncbi:hypothetical protein [Deinococcus humi]|uniref:RecT family protein n=1 Tax=Deinococcus humi TaxID=662880 RepID=A0A7W8JWC0_9DEIO|nr:hypothetical protein [Deinococcus humi]MBB5364028.1 hypothetical protein [Deinococcus humi]GGO32618.1 hypothetical protein GCM10008949_30420 [Deinococcus humi]
MTAIMHRETNTLALAGQAMQLLEFGAMLVKSRMLPSSVQSPEAAVAIMVKGMELGLPAMAALNGITVIQGKPTVSPQLMLSLINRSGQLENIEVVTGVDGACVTMKRRGRAPFTAKFGPTEARAMKLDGKDNYQKQAPVMYQWRAVAACARVVFPDVIDGLYTPEEMGADVQVDEDGAMTVTQEVKAAPTARPANITREIQEQAGTPVRTAAPSEALTGEIKTLWTEARPHIDETAYAAKYSEWRTNAGQAAALRQDLKAVLGRLPTKVEAHQEAEQAHTAPDVVDAVLTPALATSEQRQLLSQHAARAGAKTSAERAVLWGYLANDEKAIGTKELNQEQAVGILDTFSSWDNHEAAQVFAEAQKKVLAF